MTTTQEIADRLVALCREQRFVAAIEELYAADARQFENGTALPADRRGLVQACQEWLDSRDLHALEILGVHVGAEAFVVEFRYDVTPHASKQRYSWCEAGVYRVKDGKIADVRFYYKPPAS